MYLNTNLSALNARSALKRVDLVKAKSAERLAGGKRINSASDDAAGLSISEKMKAQIRGLAQAEANVSDAINLIQTADGAMNEISEMIVRQRELIIQAINDTNTPEDRQKIQDELDQLVAEIDNVAEYTNYNTIPLLKFDGEARPVFLDLTEKLHPEPLKYLTDMAEKITPSSELVEWGTLDFVQQPKQLFEVIGGTPLDAQPATATLTLGSSINLNDVTTLHGKSVTIGGSRFNFTMNSNDPVFQSGTNISFTAGETVEDVLKKITTYSGAVTKVELNTATREVTFTSPVSNQSYNVDTANGQLLFYASSGEPYNSYSVSSQQNVNLGQVDGNGSTNNALGYATTATVTVNMTAQFANAASFPLNATSIGNLVQNTIQVYTGSSWLSFGFDDTPPTAAGMVGISAGMTAAQLKTAMTTAFTNLGITSSWTGDSLNLTISGLSTTSWNSAYVYEQTVSSGSSTDTKTTTINSAGVSSSKTTGYTNENGDIYTLALPTSTSWPVSVSIAGTQYVYYDPNSYPAGADNTYSRSFPAYSTPINASSMTLSDLQNDVYNKLVAAYGTGSSRAADVSRSGGQVTVAFRAAGVASSVSYANGTGSISFSKTTNTGGGSSSVLMSGFSYFDRDVSIPLLLPGSGSVDINKLNGTGFTFMGQAFEFFDSSKGAKQLSGAIGIDINACATAQDVVNAMNAVMPGSGATKWTAAVTSGNNISITLPKYSTTYTSTSTRPSFTDGIWSYDGLFSESTDVGKAATTKRFSGGTKAEQPYTEIDFSSINSSNIDSLLGKGFRITCATCPSEFVNVLFRMSNDTEPIPSYFDMQDSSGNPVRIYNYVVELDKIKSANDIVKSIVDQLQPNLGHFTWVEVGDPATILRVEDKRRGDMKTGGVIQQASVVPGLYTNFNYELTTKRTYLPQKPVEQPPSVFQPLLPPPWGKDYQLFIQCGANAGQGLFIDRYDCRPKAIGLDKIVVDPLEEANRSLDRLDFATSIVSYYRATCGAQQNRLEYNEDFLGVALANVTESNSRVADADMAKEMMTYLKSNILSEAASAMLANAKTQPQTVLQLLK